jgi:prepilin-type N-terminal cleavage/methylation domain-containing protein
MKRQRGFNLMELAVTLTLAGAVMSLGVPNFIQFRANNLLTGVANDFLGVVLTARTEALKRQGSVSVCGSANPDEPDAECADAGITGYIAFADTNNDCLRDADEVVVRAQTEINPAIQTDADGVCLSFAANGFRQIIPDRDTVNRAVFCDDRGDALTGIGTTDSYARGFEVLPTGRARITRNRDEIVSWEADFGVECP